MMTKYLFAVSFAIASLVACDTAPPLVFPSGQQAAAATAGPPAPPPSSGGLQRTLASSISVGETVNATIESGDPRCFPNWDATGRCRQDQVRPATTGELIATLTGSGPSRGMFNTEVFLLLADGSWFRAEDAWPERHISAAVGQGESYRIVVLSYGPFPDPFELRADVTP